MEKSHLDQIAEFAIAKNVIGVREMLNIGVDYRLAQLYTEHFYNNYEASMLIHKEAHCTICGMIASNFKGESPICAGCNFRKAMQKVEYSKH